MHHCFLNGMDLELQEQHKSSSWINYSNSQWETNVFYAEASEKPLYLAENPPLPVLHHITSWLPVLWWCIRKSVQYCVPSLPVNEPPIPAFIFRHFCPIDYNVLFQFRCLAGRCLFQVIPRMGRLQNTCGPYVWRAGLCHQPSHNHACPTPSGASFHTTVLQ